MSLFHRSTWITTAALVLFASRVFSADFYGMQLSIPVSKATTSPMLLRGYQIMLNYAPDRWIWHDVSVYIDGGFTHFWMDKDGPNHSINIYSIAPVVRYSYNTGGSLTPFLEFSIGASYLNKLKLDKRPQGIHFAFQDRFGFGALLGNTQQQFSIGIHAVHYSNAHMCEQNSGITVPLVIDFGYRFS
jgi:Lipid A 3-O-deacylase (PagL)